MVGTIDSKGIRDVKSQQVITAYVLTGSEFTDSGQVGAIGISTNGDFTIYPVGISAGNGFAVQNGRWGVSVDAVASTVSGKFVVAGTVRTLSTAGTTSGNYVQAISANGSIIASVTVASYITGSTAPLAMYSSALFSNAGGIIIF